MNEPGNSQEVKFTPLKSSQVDHLILLVGENPLPNFVSALLLGKPAPTRNDQTGPLITLIHSKQTGPIKDNLRKQLAAQNFRNVDSKEVEESNPTSIYKTIYDILSNHDRIRSIGLNYTGGTKAMAVHAYQAVKSWAKDKNISPIFSYLDARSLQMVIGSVDPVSGKPLTDQPVSLDLHVPLATLVSLHSWSLGTGQSAEPQLPKITKALAELHFEETGGKAWRDWKKDILYNAVWKDGKRSKWKSKTQLSDCRISLPTGDQFEAMRKAFAEELKISPDEFLFLTAVQNSEFKIHKEGHENLTNFLDGMWLESYVLQQLLQIKSEVHLDEILRNVNVQDPSSEKNRAFFESDVLAMRGYQLFDFSCTTAHDCGETDLLKKRLFEAIIRTEQMGGSEARAALICLAEKPQDIEKEVAQMFVSSNATNPMQNKRVKVFGRPQLKNLASELKKWINEQKGVEEA